jgi:phosphatidylinositol glycan class B
MAVRTIGLLCFLPYLAVRTSAESLASSCFVLGLSILALAAQAREEPAQIPPAALAVVGFLFGLAFEFRYGVGIMVATSVAWSLAVLRLPFRRVAWLLGGLALALGLAAGVDRWGYGAWVFPPYHFFVENLVKGRAAQQFGSQPWYGYLLLPLETPIAPIVLVLMAASFLSWLRYPLHPLTWASAPYFLVHSALSHKELRFLFPIAVLTPVLFVLGVAPSKDAWDRWLRPLWESRSHPLAKALGGLNLAALAFLCLTPGRPQLGFQRFVYRHFNPRFEAYLLTPFSPYAAYGLQMHFFRPAALELHQIASMEEIGQPHPRHILLVTRPWDRHPELERTYACQPLYRGLPDWFRDLSTPWASRILAWDLYRCPALLPSPSQPSPED